MPLAETIGGAAAKAGGKTALEMSLSVRGVRRLRSWVTRGHGCFDLPKHEALILAHGNLENDRVTVADNDHSAAQEIMSLLTGFGYAEGKDWSYKSVTEPLSDGDRRKDLFLVCGSNEALRQILREHPELLSEISYQHASQREGRFFEWRNMRYEWDDTRDFAVLAIKRSPYEPGRRIVILFGLRDIGTRGAARVFASPVFRDLRRSLSRMSTQAHELEVLLRVDHSRRRDRVNDVTVAVAKDGRAIAEPSRLLPTGVTDVVLNRIYDSLDSHPRRIALDRVVNEVTYTSDGNVRSRHEITIGPADVDVLVFGRHVGADVDLRTINEVGFTASVLDGGGDVAVVPATNELRSKRFLIFPIPPVNRGEPARTYEFVSNWPGAAHKLRAIGGVDRLSFAIPSPNHLMAPVRQAIIRVRFERGDGEFRVTPAFPGASCADGPDARYSKGTEFECEITDVPPGMVLALSVERMT